MPGSRIDIALHFWVYRKIMVSHGMWLTGRLCGLGTRESDYSRFYNT